MIGTQDFYNVSLGKLQVVYLCFTKTVLVSFIAVDNFIFIEHTQIAGLWPTL